MNQTRPVDPSAVPTPLFALDVQRASMPGQPGAKLVADNGPPGKPLCEESFMMPELRE